MLLRILNNKPESEKFTHDEVGYEDPSTHGVDCDECVHFIPATKDSPAGCEGVQRPIAEGAWCHRFKEEIMKKHHDFTHTTVKHHHDGSHTTTHHHKDGEHKNVEYATNSHDAMMHGMMDHTSAPNPGEAAAEAGEHGVEPQAAAAAGLPAGAAAGA